MMAPNNGNESDERISITIADSEQNGEEMVGGCDGDLEQDLEQDGDLEEQQFLNGKGMNV